MYPSYELNGKKQSLSNICIFPKEDFEVGKILGRGYCVHRCEASWKKKTVKKKLFFVIKKAASYVPVVHVDSIIRHWTYRIYCRQSPYYEEYVKAKFQK